MNPLTRYSLTLTVAMASQLSLPIQAQTHPGGTLPLWEIGTFGTALSQQAYPGSSQVIDRALVLPYFIYRGQYLRADRGSVGVRAIKTDTIEFDVGFSGAFGSNSNEIEARKGMPDLGTLVEFGPRVKWNLGSAPGNARLRAELALRGVFDLSDNMKDKGLSLEPELIYERMSSRDFRYSTSIGLVFGDERLTETFYGVAPVYATSTRSVYRAQSGLIMSRLSLNATYSMTPNLRIFGFGRLSSIDGGANGGSPLVRQSTSSTLGFGLLYTLMRSDARAND